jgi:hypothetical protein
MDAYLLRRGGLPLRRQSVSQGMPALAVSLAKLQLHVGLVYQGAPNRMQTIDIEPLTKAAFAGFGDVVDKKGVEWIEISRGLARRVNEPARIDVATRSARSTFRC